ncbi:hypothetical protein DL93DRAFT_2232379 [Clavulina sp. PMI_390]|nr:hypothetical protein DL93DRAFT_2232379 [Clavulina sp. PMI_390]
MIPIIKHPLNLESLPIEVIQDIIVVASPSPRHYHEIVKLSHISSAWRSATLSLSHLSVSPQWDKWSRDLCSRWVARAGLLGLEASVQAYYHLDALERLASSCEKLIGYADWLVRLHLTAESYTQMTALPSMMSLLTNSSFPRLEALIVVGDFGPWTISSTNMPHLNTCFVRTFYSNVLLVGPFLYLEQLAWTLSNQGDLDQITTVLGATSRPLELSFYGPYHSESYFRPSIAYDSFRFLKLLRLSGFPYYKANEPFLHNLINWFRAPNLRFLALENLKSAATTMVIKALISTDVYWYPYNFGQTSETAAFLEGAYLCLNKAAWWPVV